MRAAIAQVAASEGFKMLRMSDLNLSRISTDIVVLPENWISSTPVDIADYVQAIEEIYVETGSRAVFGGAQYVLIDEKVVSAGVAVVDGKSYLVCEKLFPSRAVGERGRIEAGRLVKPVKVAGFSVGCIVCVDIFYPEVSRALSLLGADIIVNPSKIPIDKEDVWRSVLSARAAESIVYTIGVNPGSGRYRDGRPVSGGSAVFNPDGTPRLLMGRIVSTSTVEIDLDSLSYYRRRYAYHEDLIGRLASHYKRLADEAIDPVRI